MSPTRVVIGSILRDGLLKMTWSAIRIPAHQLQSGATVRIWRGIGQSNANDTYLDETIPA